MPKICEMQSVRELTEEYPVELWRNDKTGRLVVRAKNEGGNNVTEVDLLELIEWCQRGPLPEGLTHGSDSAGDRAGASPSTLLLGSRDVPDAP
jgi:hypothetical protein